MRTPRHAAKQLTCASCGDVIAEATYRPLIGSLTIIAPEGYQLFPSKGALLIRIAEQQLADASSAAQEELAQKQLTFIQRYLGEVMYDLPCHRGHYTLATAPQIAHALRRAKGNWVSLSELPS